MSVKQERHDEAEIQELAAKMVEENKAKMATPQRAPNQPGTSMNILSYLNTNNAKSKSSATGSSSNSGDVSDDASVRGRFGWIAIAKSHIPYIIRGEEFYCSVRMVEMKILNRYLTYLHPDIYNCTCIRSYFITEAECRLLNEINMKHCDCQFGREQFTTMDLIVRLTDAEEFFKFLSACYSKLLSGEISTTDRCGFIRINKESVVPYTIYQQQKYVPLFYFEGETDNLKQKADKLEGWDLSYLKFCCKVQGIRNELFAHDSCSVISLNDIKNYFPPGTLFEDYWPKKNMDSQLLISNSNRAPQQIIQWTRQPTHPPIQTKPSPSPKPATQAKAATNNQMHNMQLYSTYGITGGQPAFHPGQPRTASSAVRAYPSAAGARHMRPNYYNSMSQVPPPPLVRASQPQSIASEKQDAKEDESQANPKPKTSKKTENDPKFSIESNKAVKERRSYRRKTYDTCKIVTRSVAKKQREENEKKSKELQTASAISNDVDETIAASVSSLEPNSDSLILCESFQEQDNIERDIDFEPESPKYFETEDQCTLDQSLEVPYVDASEILEEEMEPLESSVYECNTGINIASGFMVDEINDPSNSEANIYPASASEIITVVMGSSDNNIVEENENFGHPSIHSEVNTDVNVSSDRSDQSFGTDSWNDLSEFESSSGEDNVSLRYFDVSSNLSLDTSDIPVRAGHYTDPETGSVESFVINCFGQDNDDECLIDIEDLDVKDFDENDVTVKIETNHVDEIVIEPSNSSNSDNFGIDMSAGTSNTTFQNSENPNLSVNTAGECSTASTSKTVSQNLNVCDRGECSTSGGSNHSKPEVSQQPPEVAIAVNQINEPPVELEESFDEDRDLYQYVYCSRVVRHSSSLDNITVGDSDHSDDYGLPNINNGIILCEQRNYRPPPRPRPPPPRQYRSIDFSKEIGRPN